MIFSDWSCFKNLFVDNMHSGVACKGAAFIKYLLTYLYFKKNYAIYRNTPTHNMMARKDNTDDRKRHGPHTEMIRQAQYTKKVSTQHQPCAQVFKNTAKAV